MFHLTLKAHLARLTVFSILFIASPHLSQAQFGHPPGSGLPPPIFKIPEIRAPENFLTLYLFPSPQGIDWSTPKKLTASTMANTLAQSPYTLKHSLGHVSVELKCDDGRFSYSGMTTRSSTEELGVVFVQKLGLGTLFHSFQGRLQTENEILNDIRERKARRDVNWIRFKISSKTCQRLKDYAYEYRKHQVDEVYGLPHRPRMKEGAGCSAYAVSFVELAGLLTDEFKTAWSGEKRVPEALIGKPGKRVGLGTLLTSNRANSWAKPNEPHRRIFYWDPDTMIRWLKMKTRDQGLVYDRVNTPTPDEPIWVK